MRLIILLNPHLVRRWQVDLAEALRAAGHQLKLKLGSGTAPPRGLDLLERFEETLYGRDRPLGARLSDAEIRSTVDSVTGDPGVDLGLDLTGQADPDGRIGRWLRLSADGLPLEAGIADALIDRRAPTIDWILSAPGQADTVLTTGVPAVPDANVFIKGLETVSARLVTLGLLAVTKIDRGLDGDSLGSERSIPRYQAAVSSLDACAFITRSLGEKIALRLRRMSEKADRWTVGWRELHDDAVIDRLKWPDADYHWLPDDGLRYYADPFVVADDDKRYLFVEEYVYATGRGHLSVASWSGSGWTTPQPIIERPYHLSWPRVFALNGEFWMIPESSEARTVELYRATAFPYHWEQVDVVARDISLADVTMIERGDGWWMLAAIVDRPGASSWDGLAILRADDPLSSWRLTGQGAVLIDARAARPAGDLVSSAGRWLRPVQDCSLGYGSALGIARIDRLEDGFIQQTVIARLQPKPEWQAIGVHTLNAAAGLEVIDINRGFDIRRNPLFD